MTPERSICILPQLTGLGGPSSFQARLKTALEERGWKTVHDPFTAGCAALLVIGGPRRHMGTILSAQRNGLRVVQRLNGMNWIHRRRWNGLRYSINAELNNLTIAYIRRKANRIVYQSRFSREWWERVFGKLDKPQTVIFNGVDLDQYSPNGDEKPPQDRIRMLVVEGHISKGFEMGVQSAVKTARELETLLDRPVELVIAGEASDETRQKWGSGLIHWTGIVPGEQIPALDRSAHFLFSADINAACPNSVVEALACGLPVAAFSTGALPEMITPQSGVLAPYGGDPWKLDAPDVKTLAAQTVALIRQQDACRLGARARAVEAFDLGKIAESYLKILVD